MKLFVLTVCLLLAWITPAAAQSIGVADCDAYLAILQQCVDKQPPPEMVNGKPDQGSGKVRAMEGLESMRNQYLGMKGNVSNAELGAACKDSRTASKQLFEMMQCGP